MADYESFPTWLTGAARVGNINPGELSISDSLAGSLLRWAQAYDDTLDPDDPTASGFSSSSQEEDFYRNGYELARLLATELSDRYHVEYFDGRTGQLVSVDRYGW
ncbi:hypothetical protein [Micromonospora sp. RTGN7]|uniref:hypothetical protein n=1 Tax=Micromonospora sp. RTGN7 TaxID=3016526 RepID=UPI0029FF4C00|nr:hypothetical protein [Micromonospora sp. RTGN7]